MSNTTANTGERLVIRRTYNAKRERVWKAWTNAEEMVLWASPDGMSVPELEADIRVGGTYRLTMMQPSGEKYIAKGVYREVTPPEKLAYTWTWEEDTPEEEHETLLTIEFRDLGEQTELILTHENLASAQSRDNHTRGWNQWLDKLAEHVGDSH
ncbi:MAG: SRPBCC domain-containing protein [Candidatus Eremiobacteraeota bacterium]|nr:SRPBCC domain-containing protein [Candidatus Eremiobacteraeota bacterium]